MEPNNAPPQAERSPVDELLANLKTNARTMRSFSARLPNVNSLLTAFVSAMILRGDHTSDEPASRIMRDIALHLAIESADQEDVLSNVEKMNESKVYNGPIRDAKTMLIGGDKKRLIVTLLPERGVPMGIGFEFDAGLKFADTIKETIAFLQAPPSEEQH